MDDTTKKYIADLSAWFAAEVARVSGAQSQDALGGPHGPPPPPPVR